MKSTILLGLVGLSLAIFGAAAVAQSESTNRVAAKTDWSVFVESDPTSCWSVSSPKESVNTKDGRVVAVRRGDTLLFVTYIPSKGANGQISFTGGYKFSKNSLVAVQIGSQTFQLFTKPEDDPDTPQNETEMSWATTDADDTKIVAAMKRGAEAIVTGLSSRGTTTKDTFSLLGFTAALEEASNRCSG